MYLLYKNEILLLETLLHNLPLKSPLLSVEISPAQVVAPQGYLAYMTCTYSIEENEQVCEWFLARFPQFQPVEISHLERYQSHLTTVPCYRLFPQDGMGAGTFTALFQNQENMSQSELNGHWERFPLMVPLDHLKATLKLDRQIQETS